jgi:amphi-Trp domain-containing protein
MGDELIYEEQSSRKRRRLASFFDRFARRLRRGETVPIDEDQNVTVAVPEESELTVELDREDGTVTLGLELDWEEASGAVETDVVASKARFEVYEGAGDEYRWRLVHRNGNIIADGSEGYASKQKAKQGLEGVRTNASGAYIIDQSNAEDAPEEGGSNALFTLYEDEGEQWRWRLVHRNGNIIAEGSQGYSSKQKARQGLASVQTNTAGAPVVEPE